MPTKLIVGLGNPGIQYQFTPHNLGFLTVDRLAEIYNAHVSNRRGRALTGKAMIANHEVLLAKPETFMNLSGLAVSDLVEQTGVDPERDMIVIYDELDLPFGMIRVRERGSAGGHNGLKSIIGALDTQEFLRIRLGIGPEHKPRDGAGYVLSQLKKSQYDTVDQMLESAAEAVKVILTEGPAAAMSRYNKKASPETQDEKSSS
jgi:peptidyl-tRNA hydrolase, PTH1 family